jgi:hypothetical protein
MENPSLFASPGGIEIPQIGNPLASDAIIYPTHRMHHVTGTNYIKNISTRFLWPDFIGPLFLLADSDLWTWDDTGNIAASLGSGKTVVAGNAYPFVYDRTVAKWYPMSDVKQDGV